MAYKLTLREDLIATLGALTTDPLSPETPRPVLQRQYGHIDALMTRLLTDPVDGLAWDAVPPEMRQTFLLAGLAALGTALESQLNQEERTPS